MPKAKKGELPVTVFLDERQQKLVNAAIRTLLGKFHFPKVSKIQYVLWSIEQTSKDILRKAGIDPDNLPK